MQNRYTGDIGDFGKYGLLRFLFMPELEGLGLRLGVNWYLVPNENHNDDGKFTTYLDNTEPNNINLFETCDSILYSKLQEIVNENKRNVFEIEQRHIFTDSIQFYNETLSFQNVADRNHSRQDWVEKGLLALHGCNVVFFDPDNGIEVKSYNRTCKKGPKYVFYDELEPYYKRGQSLIIYNHKSRQPEEEYLERYRGLKEKLKPKEDIFYLRFNRFSVRDFVFVLQPEHLEIRERVKKMLKTPWSKHFKYYELR